MTSLIERAKQHGSDFGSYAAQRAGDLRSGAGSSLAKAQEAIRDKRGAITEALSGMVKEGVDLSELKAAGYGMAGSQYNERKKQAALALLHLGSGVRVKVLLAIREALKDAAVADPDMWSCVRTRIEAGLDLFWDDLTVYIETMENDQKEVVRGKQIADIEGLEKLGDKPCIGGPGWWRALVLYHYLPFDISVFGQVKDPLFWIFTVVSMVPTYGMRVIFFSLILLLHLGNCPADEYQLVGYILTFKGTQFLSSGIGMAVFAAVKYYMCVHPGGHHTCDENGPASSMDLTGSSIDFLGSCILVWVAFLCLPCSTRSAGLRDIGGDADKDEARTKCCCCFWDPKRGGRLTGLLAYDLFMFLLCCGLLYGEMYTDAAHLRPGGKDVRTDISQGEIISESGSSSFKSAVFWARVAYSSLSFPFAIFYLPVLNSILTHTTATGYNRQGLCVPYYLHPMPKAED